MGAGPAVPQRLHSHLGRYWETSSRWMRSVTVGTTFFSESHLHLQLVSLQGFNDPDGGRDRDTDFTTAAHTSIGFIRRHRFKNWHRCLKSWQNRYMSRSYFLLFLFQLKAETSQYMIQKCSLAGRALTKETKPWAPLTLKSSVILHLAHSFTQTLDTHCPTQLGKHSEDPQYWQLEGASYLLHMPSLTTLTRAHSTSSWHREQMEESYASDPK